MTPSELTGALAEEILGWQRAPGRFLMKGRRWIPDWRFQPLKNFDDAFRLLQSTACVFTLSSSLDGSLIAEVRIGKISGRAVGYPPAAVVTVALARAIGLEVTDESLVSSAVTRTPKG